MTIETPPCTIAAPTNHRNALILQRVTHSPPWLELCELHGIPEVTVIYRDETPVLFTFDLTDADERFERYLYSNLPTATKMGPLPEWLLWMTGKKYRLTPIEDRLSDR